MMELNVPLHVDDIKALARQAHGDGEVREALFAALKGDDRRAAVNAAWALTHLPKADNQHIAARREPLVELALSTPDTSLRRLSLALLERLEWGRDQVRTDLLDFCLDRLLRADEPAGVRALCLKLAYSQCRHYAELREELRQCLLMLEPSELLPGIRHTRNKIMKQL